jgi:putative toxin-antitoxin system antitoxin component (TIGR02293 family)
MVAAQKIAEVMGMKRTVRSLADLSGAVVRGLPKSALRHCVDRVAASPQERRQLMFRVVPEATFKRRRNQLKLEESERTERLARVIATAEYVWDDREEARRFLTTPHPELRDRRPLDAALTELGARRVEEMLWSIFHGLPV